MVDSDNMFARKAAPADPTEDSELQHVDFFPERAKAAPPHVDASVSEMNPRAPDFKPHSTQHMHLSAGPGPSLASAPQPIASHLYELRQTSDHGLALFATSYLARGTLIICEEPLLKIAANAIHYVWGEYCSLSDAQKATYDALFPYTPPSLDLERESRLHLVDHDEENIGEEHIERLVAEHVRVMSVFAANNFALPPNGLAVYATASRLNHSCVPNVHHSYNPNLNRMTVHAARNILPNEELLTTYLGGDGVYQLRDIRIANLRTAYGFICQCPACADDTGASDARRDLLNCLSWGLDQFSQGIALENPFIPAGPLSAFRQAEHLISLMLEEGLFTIELTKAYRRASSAALTLQDFDRALEYAYDEAVVERNCLGTKINDLRKIGAATESWIGMIYQRIQEEKGEEVVKIYRGTVRGEKKKARKKSGGKKAAKAVLAVNGDQGKDGEAKL